MNMQPIGARIGQRLQHDAVDDAEDGGVGADAERQRQDGDGGVGRALEQGAEDVAHVGYHISSKRNY